MAKAAAKDHFEKPSRKKKEKPEPVTTLAAAGHNSGGIIEEVKSKMDEYLASCERQKAEGKLQREIKAFLKQGYAIRSSVFSHEVRLRKMALDERIQFESGHKDLKLALGFQHELDLKVDTVARTEEEYIDPSNRATLEVIQREG
jgi:CCR4-NOT transcriptional regulation complex NOT5 subunit